MSADEKPVEGEIVPPRDGLPPAEGPRPFFHPMSGIVILAIDWITFGTDLLSGAALLALGSVAAFLLTYASVRRIQQKMHGDTPGRARLKALLGGLAAGVPFPIAGTIVGALILSLSGLPRKPK